MLKSVIENAIHEIMEDALLRKTFINYGIDRTTLTRYKLNEQKLHKFEKKLRVECLLLCSKMY